MYVCCDCKASVLCFSPLIMCVLTVCCTRWGIFAVVGFFNEIERCPVLSTSHILCCVVCLSFWCVSTLCCLRCRGMLDVVFLFCFLYEHLVKGG